MKRFASISDFTDTKAMEAFTGAISGINKTTLFSGAGFSGAALERIDVETTSGLKHSFMLKHTRLNADWLSLRTNDTIGREAALLDEKRLSKVWESIHCPYLAFAMEEGEIAMLMNDLSEYLFPDVREPIDIKAETTILYTLASLHAAFWESPEIKKINWLGQPNQYLEVLGPGRQAADAFALPPAELLTNINRGWEIAFDILPGDIKSMLLQPAEKILEHWKGLPFTLLHGDTKIANMALMPDGSIAAFDWAFVGRGPCSIDLGWYIAVNATRLARTKEQVISTYRAFLESRLQYAIEEKIWLKMIDLAVFTGAKMLLWSKGIAYATGTEKGKNEWDWWIQKLKMVAGHIQ